MPFYQKPRGFTPLLVAAEKKSVKNGLRHAIFTSRFDRYIGDWKKDLKDGKGKFLTVDGLLYEGDWCKGYRHGFGLLSRRLPNGTYKLLYRGDWARGKPEGAGWMFYENEDIYLGFWRQGLMTGFGNMWYSNKTFYVGHWSKGMKAGLGMYVLENGNRYEGNWKNDVKSGLGRYYHMHTGQIQEGCWMNDVCVQSKMSDMIMRQTCDLPTPYPIPQNKLKFPRRIMEVSDFWTQQKVADIDKNLRICVDKMLI